MGTQHEASDAEVITRSPKATNAPSGTVNSRKRGRRKPMLENVLPAESGLNRTTRRQLARARGERGTKAKRKHGPQPRFNPPSPEQKAEMLAALNAQQQAEQDHQERNRLRRLGMIVPPSAEEGAALRSQGHAVGAGGLLLPPS